MDPAISAEKQLRRLQKHKHFCPSHFKTKIQKVGILSRFQSDGRFFFRIQKRQTLFFLYVMSFFQILDQH